MNVNLMAGIYMCRLVLPHMYKQNSGSIVNITSVGGMTGFPRQTTYSAAKWGMNGLTKALAKEAGPHGIRVNVMTPVFIITEMTPENRPAFDSYKAASPIGMLGEPEHIAEAVPYVVSEEFMTGQVISLNGGLVI